MASKHFVKNVFVCVQCQRRLARAAPFIQSPLGSGTSKFPLHRQNQPERSFVSSVSWSDQLQKNGRGVTSISNGLVEGQQTTAPFHTAEDAPSKQPASETPLAGDNSAPWYLQEQEDQSEPNPFLERQKIPDLPQNPPPILEPLLQHASIDLGLDYLSLIDLRTLDPPPALGTNLVMLFGSARSEKHLNVSADRLCRWLRSNYKLKPFADGLLGRNELKLKLRRRNRRAKTMSAAGASTPTDPDDGTTTGWICVNVGAVENGPQSTAKEQAHEPSNFVGFGSGIEGARIVVQIMTEEKRGELDLETLWKEALDAAARRQAGTPAERMPEASRQVLDSLPEIPETQSALLSNAPSVDSRSSVAHRDSVSPGHPHVRRFHTFFRGQSSSGADVPLHRDAEIDREFVKPMASAQDLSALEYDGALPAASARVPNELHSSLRTNDEIQKQLSYIQTLKPSLSIWLLGKGQEDYSSTAFLRSFHQCIPIIRDTQHLFACFELHCYAMRIGHLGYTRERLVQLLNEMQASAIWIPEEVFLVAFKTMLMAHNTLDASTMSQRGNLNEKLRSGEMLGQALCRVLSDAFEVLERMESYGHDARSIHVLTILHNAIANPVFEPPPALPQPSLSTTNASPESIPPAKLIKSQHARFRYLFRRALDTIYSPPVAENSLYTHMLRSYIAASPPDWSSFWDLWHHFARLMRPRTPEMYSLMFNAVANTEHASKCQETLMWQFPEMDREIPVVKCKGEVAGAVLECLIKARVPRDAPPWDEMWSAAEKGL